MRLNKVTLSAPIGLLTRGPGQWQSSHSLMGPTVDGEAGRRLRLAHHVLRHAGIGAYVGGGQPSDLQGVVLTNLVSVPA